jgi:DNA-binding NtrC family response regulator
MNKINVLLVDDEEDLVTALVDRLNIRGFNADACVNFNDAINQIEKKKYDIIIIDVKLRGINGIRLMKIMKESQPSLKVILITGHGTEAEGREGIMLGAYDYLIKPVDIDTLTEKIRKAVEQA